MTQVLAIAAGGAAGGVLRYWLTQAVHAATGRAFPYGTLVVNVVGCFLMGLLFVLLDSRNETVLRAGVLIGILGGFTTFSAFSMETYLLMQQGAWLKAVANAVLSVGVCVAATSLGVLLAKQW